MRTRIVLLLLFLYCTLILYCYSRLESYTKLTLTHVLENSVFYLVQSDITQSKTRLSSCGRNSSDLKSQTVNRKFRLFCNCLPIPILYCISRSVIQVYCIFQGYNKGQSKSVLGQRILGYSNYVTCSVYFLILATQKNWYNKYLS